MFTDLLNLFNVKARRKLKTTLQPTDQIVIGSKFPSDNGKFAPTTIKYSDLAAQISANSVQSVTGLDTDNTDPLNPVVQLITDGVTITGFGTALEPLAVVNEYTETIITVGPSTTTYSDGRPPLATGILGWGTARLLLDPAPGEYYDIEASHAKWIPGSNNYTTTGTYILLTYASAYIAIEKSFMTGFSGKAMKLPPFLGTVATYVKASNSGSGQVGQGVYVSIDNLNNPSTGDGIIVFTMYSKKIPL